MKLGELGGPYVALVYTYRYKTGHLYMISEHKLLCNVVRSYVDCLNILV